MKTTVNYCSQQGFAMALADAYEAVAKANHYMVGVLARDDLAQDALDAAEQELIRRQNTIAQWGKSARWQRLELALDILAYDRNRLRPGRIAARETFADYGSPARED